jgi:hypothetical protein
MRGIAYESICRTIGAGRAAHVYASVEIFGGCDAS